MSRPAADKVKLFIASSGQMPANIIIMENPDQDGAGYAAKYNDIIEKS